MDKKQVTVETGLFKAGQIPCGGQEAADQYKIKDLW
jgi:hypothetical protein